MTDNKPDPASDQIRADAAKRPFNPDGGEDEASTSSDGDESDLHEDQKPITGDTDLHKVEKLTKAGRNMDLDEVAE